jgi:hypothetical protein
MYYDSPDWTPYRFGFNNPTFTNDITGLFESKDAAKSYKREHHIRGKISYNSKDNYWELKNKKYSYSAGNDLGVSEMKQFKNDGVIQSTVTHQGKNSKYNQNQSKWIDNFQITLDIAGTFDPTGIVDGVNAIIYASRGQWVNAGISALAIVPYIGDLGKLGKLEAKLAAKGAGLLDEAAELVKLNGGKNSVTIESATQKIRYDLAGKAHGGVPTPHKQVYNKNFVDGVQKSVSKASKEALPMTKKDLDLVRKYLTNQ